MAGTFFEIAAEVFADADDVGLEDLRQTQRGRTVERQLNRRMRRERGGAKRSPRGRRPRLEDIDGGDAELAEMTQQAGVEEVPVVAGGVGVSAAQPRSFAIGTPPSVTGTGRAPSSSSVCGATPSVARTVAWKSGTLTASSTGVLLASSVTP